MLGNGSKGLSSEDSLQLSFPAWTSSDHVCKEECKENYNDNR